MSQAGKERAISPLRVVIVDDEPLARDELAFLLSEVGGVEVVAEAADADVAARICAETNPHAAFVDLRMPGPDGVALAQALAGRHPPVAVVVVSAHEEGASRVFEAGLVDYLLKPVRLERLRRAVRRLREWTGLRDLAEEEIERIALRHGGSWVVRSVEDVLFFEVRDELVWAVTAEERFTVDRPLSDLERRLPPGRFFRTHRAALVRLDAIEAIEPAGAGTYRVVVAHPDRPRLPLARERARGLRERISFLG